MELIDKQKIEKAASDYSMNKPNTTKRTFVDGVKFAQTEITPLFCEFADYCQDYWLDVDDRKTTQQLFDLWLESRAK